MDAVRVQRYCDNTRLFFLDNLISQRIYNLAYGFAAYFDTMSNKSKGALCEGSYVTRLAKNLSVFNTLTGLTRSYSMIALNMDTFHSMHLVEKRGD